MDKSVLDERNELQSGLRGACDGAFRPNDEPDARQPARFTGHAKVAMLDMSYSDLP
jgi:hypothetical protein